MLVTLCCVAVMESPKEAVVELQDSEVLVSSKSLEFVPDSLVEMQDSRAPMSQEVLAQDSL